MTEDSSLFGSRSRADTLRSASATRGDAAVLLLAANSGNLSLTEASIWRISVKRRAARLCGLIYQFQVSGISAVPGKIATEMDWRSPRRHPPTRAR